MTKKDWFVEGFAAAVTDIRQKVVEEPWFGKPVTPVASQTPQSLGEALNWASTPTDEQPAPQTGPEPDPGMEH